MLRVIAGNIAKRFSPTIWADPEVVPYAAKVSVWGRWLLWVVSVFNMAHRPSDWYPDDIAYLFLHVPLVMLNGLVHFRLWTHRPVTWRWMLGLSAMDIALITAAIVIDGEFQNFTVLAYYPALALFAAVFTSFWLGMAWTTMAAIAYAASNLGPDSGFDPAAGDLRVLVSRLAAMYATVLCVSLVTRFERTKRQAAVERERQMQQERIELSQTIHDTAAQTAYMIGLGIHRIKRLAGESDDELVETLDATAALSMSAMWELRRPIDAGHVFEGRSLERVLQSHCASFEKITGVPTEMSRSGLEPPLATETRFRLFSIAHNALTNAFRHARPGRVEVRLEFDAGRVRLSVSDDGVGLPVGYAVLGRGFESMESDAARIGGELMVKSQEDVGTTIVCLTNLAADERGG